MPRTTIDIDAAILRRLNERKRREGKSLGRVVSELLATALDQDAGAENVLLHASDEASDRHARARAALDQVAAGGELVYLFWPVVMAYLRVATHPGIFERPLSREEATANVERLLSLPHVQTAGESDRFWRVYRDAADEGDARGDLVPDAHVVALMLENGVRRIWTHDRDYRRFRGIDVHDPFAG